MTRSLIIGAAALLAALPALADSRDTGPRRGAALPAFETLLPEGAETLSLAAFQDAFKGLRGQRSDALVARLMQEADEDGRLNEEALRRGLAAHGDELRQGQRGQMQARLFQRMDRDNDGEISRAEYEAFTTRMGQARERGNWRRER